MVVVSLLLWLLGGGHGDILDSFWNHCCMAWVAPMTHLDPWLLTQIQR
jgi:hypothetical protein